MTVDSTERHQAILRKTVELCQTITDQPFFASQRASINAFLADEGLQAQYSSVLELSEKLDDKQANGIALEADEVREFESQRDQLMSDPTAESFIEAQREIHKVQETIGQYVAKTFELGRVPESSDFDSGSCGPSCGCH